MLLHVDDALSTSDQGKRVIRNELGKCFCIKDESIGTPALCLGNKVSQVELENGVKA